MVRVCLKGNNSYINGGTYSGWTATRNPGGGKETENNKDCVLYADAKSIAMVRTAVKTKKQVESGKLSECKARR